MERHPPGSPAFPLPPMDGFLIVAPPDEERKPVRLQAFVSQLKYGINVHPNRWHGVRGPLSGSGLFPLVD